MLNKTTTLYCLKVCLILFTLVATGIAVAVELKTGNKEDPITIFIACELFGYGLAIFIFMVAITEGYLKARLTINQFNKIDRHLKAKYSLEIIK